MAKEKKAAEAAPAFKVGDKVVWRGLKLTVTAVHPTHVEAGSLTMRVHVEDTSQFRLDND